VIVFRLQYFCPIVVIQPKLNYAQQLKLSKILIATILGFLVLGACSQSKDIFTARTYHRMVSKYNILFNGGEALLKAETSLITQHKDDYDELLTIYREGTEVTASSVKPDLEKVLEKGGKTIQNHSMLIDGKQKNTYIDDAYLLMGKGHYFNRNYPAALETFNFVIQKFREPALRAEAELWAAKTETALENYVGAKARFDKLYSNKSLSQFLDADVYAAFAHLEVVQGNYESAYQLLIQAAEKTKVKEQEVRWLYICGQLQAKMENDFEASQLFKRVIKKGPPYELLFNAQLNQARSYDVDLMDPSVAYEQLEKMLGDEKNYDNRDRIYYVMAEVAQKLEAADDRDEYLNQSIRVSTQNIKQKAESYLWLAELRFEEKRYEPAQAYYDSCYQFLPKDHPKYATVQVFKKSLGRLVGNLQIIALEDSLQVLAELSEKQQLSVIESIIAALKEADEDARIAEEQGLDNIAFNAANQGDNGGIGGLAGVGNANQTFYFYNPQLRSGGVSKFVGKWGNRKLEDNWRREDKAIVQVDPNFNNSDPNAAATADGDKELDPRYDPQTYLVNIPNDSIALAASHLKIQTALLDNALLYKEDIEDLNAAANSVLDLLKRYPDYKDRVRAWYILYRVYVAQEDQVRSKKYRDLILDTYPKSEYAYLILNEGREEKAINESAAVLDYTLAYNQYELKNYRTAFKLAKAGFETHEDSRFGSKFLLLKAYCEGRMQQIKELKETLELVLKRYPRTDQSAEAQKILKAMGTDTGDQSAQAKKANKYKTDFSTPHRYIIVVKNGEINANQLNIKLSNFSTKYYPNDRLKVKSLLMGTEWQLLMVNGLNNKQRAEDFFRTINNENALDQALGSADYKQFVISNANFATFYKNQDIKAYLDFYRENYQ
jgi:TolA-binding protein